MRHRTAGDDSRPPRFLSLLLRRSLPPGTAGATILGDLHEEYEQHRPGWPRTLWYTVVVLKMAIGYLGSRLRPGRFSTAPNRRPTGVRTLDNFAQDVRYGVRMLTGSPGFTTVAVLSLALGIGATTTIFSVMNAALLRSLPVENPDRLVRLYSSGSGGFGPIPYSSYVDYRDQNHVFTGLAASVAPGRLFLKPMNLRGWDAPTQVNGLAVSGDYFSVLGVRPVLGRGFLPEEDRTPGTHPVVVISHGLWQGRFGSDPNVVGDIVVLNGQPFTVVGVAPKGFPGRWGGVPG